MSRQMKKAVAAVVQALHFAFSEAELTGAAPGRVFGLTPELVPQRPALAFTP